MKRNGLYSVKKTNYIIYFMKIFAIFLFSIAYSNALNK